MKSSLSDDEQFAVFCQRIEAAHQLGGQGSRVVLARIRQELLHFAKGAASWSDSPATVDTVQMARRLALFLPATCDIEEPNRPDQYGQAHEDMQRWFKELSSNG